MSLTLPTIAVESAKEAAHRLLELCMTDAPPLDRDAVRSHALDVIEALTPDEDHPTCPEGGAPDPETGAYCPTCLARQAPERIHPLFLDETLILPPGVPGPGLRAHFPVLAVCPECQQGKHGNCDTTAWDHITDTPTACSCTHPVVGA